MLRRILLVDYDALCQYLLDKYSTEEHRDDPNFLDFENIRAYLNKEAENMCIFPEDEEGVYNDPELTEILLNDLGPDKVLSITVTKLPGLIHSYADHLLKLPLILIEAEWRLEWQS